MPNKPDPGLCRVCGKPLKLYSCPTCGGSGKVRARLVMKRDCGACAGTGCVRRCPDQFAHLVQWQFWAVSTAVFGARTRSQHSITLQSLRKLVGEPVGFDGRAAAVRRVAEGW